MLCMYHTQMPAVSDVGPTHLAARSAARVFYTALRPPLPHSIGHRRLHRRVEDDYVDGPAPLVATRFEAASLLGMCLRTPL